MLDDGRWELPICLSDLEAIAWSHVFDNNSFTDNVTSSPIADAAHSAGNQRIRSREWIQIVLPIICTVGITGNVLNLVVLTRKRFCATMGKLERSANLGLTALALSDMVFCSVVLPNSFIPEDPGSMSPVGEAFILYYKVYGVSCINLFLMTSTWLIVALAIERYIVLYYPLRAKWLLTLKRTKLILLSIYFLSVILTLPYFFNKTVTLCERFNGDIRREISQRWQHGSASAQAVEIYNVHIWPVFAVFCPLVVLFVCNIRLVQGLRNIPTTRRLKCPGQKIRDVNTRITLTLIIIVATALILVTPSEILKVINPFKRWGVWGVFIASIANLMQSLNFAFNFVLYCAIDRNFRQICRNIVIGHCRPKHLTLAETEVIFYYRPKTGSYSLRGPRSSTTTSSRSERYV